MKNKPLSRKNNQRSWPVTIVAGLVALTTLLISKVVFSTNLPGVLMSLAFLFFAILALIIAIQGRKKTLRDLVESLIYLP